MLCVLRLEDIISIDKGGGQVAVEEIRQDIRIVEQIVDDMDLFDDDLMAMVFDGNNLATGLLLKIILNETILP